MSLNTNPCDPAADSFVDLDYADGYLSAHPDNSCWENLPGDDLEQDEVKEKLLIAASRMISRAPLSKKPLAENLDWRSGQGLAAPVAGHGVYYGVADSALENEMTDAALAGGAPERYIGGAIRTEEGVFIGVEDFDPEIGAVALTEICPKEFQAGSPYALVEAISPAVKQAACEQALFLASAPNLSILDEIELGLRSASAEGAGGGQISLRAARNTGELCFAARRLLASCGLLRDAGSIASGRA